MTPGADLAIRKALGMKADDIIPSSLANMVDGVEKRIPSVGGGLPIHPHVLALIMTMNGAKPVEATKEKGIDSLVEEYANMSKRKLFEICKERNITIPPGGANRETIARLIVEKEV